MAADEANGPRLVVTTPPDLADRVLPLSGPELVIGHSGADLVLEDRFVSRRHALVTVSESGQVTIRDLNSTGGTFVNGERLAASRLLRDGDLVQFANLVTRFEPGRPPPAPADAATQLLAVPVAPVAPPVPVAPAPPVPVAPVAPPVPVQPAPPVPVPAPAPPGPVPPPIAVPPPTIYTVSGTVASPALPGAGGLTVQLVDKNVGGDQLLATTQTGGDGS